LKAAAGVGDKSTQKSLNLYSQLFSGRGRERAG